MEYYSATKRYNESLLVAATEMELENIVVSKISQAQKHK
jgi:hypothetical protein